MLIAHVADLHLCEHAREGTAALDEQVDTLLWIGQHASQAAAQVMLVAGDVFDALSTPAERNAAIRVFTGWAEDLPVIVVYGNHDRPRDLDFLGRLRAENDIVVVDRPDVIEMGGAAVACLPWPRKANLVATLGSTSATEASQAAGDAMRALLRGLSTALGRCSPPTILLGHVELGTALADSGQPLAGRCDIELGEHDLLEVGADAVLLGHVHKHQLLGDGRIVYAGSPRQTTFGEDANKGYCLVEVERGRAPAVTHVRAPGHELVTVAAFWHELHGLVVETDPGKAAPITEAAGVPPGAAARLVYEVPAAFRAEAAEAAASARSRWLELGAHSVKIEARVMPTTRVRSEEIRKAKTNADRIEAWWASRGDDAGQSLARPERAAEVLAKLEQLEREVEP